MGPESAELAYRQDAMAICGDLEGVKFILTTEECPVIPEFPGNIPGL